MAQISIIVPVYNTEKFLAQCLDSICRQTLNNLEFLVIDDGSTDRSGAICDEYAARDPRIKVFRTENHGPSAARNLGLEYARKNGSEYVGFVDSDDWIEPDMFEVLYAAATKYHADVVECGVYSEVPDKTEVWCLHQFCVYDTESGNYDHIWKTYNNYVWNKLWKISWSLS